MNTKKIARIFVISGASLVSGTAYEPAPKPQPSANIVSKYLTTHTARYKYDPSINRADHARSEQRKAEIVGKITNIRAQIREKMLTTVLCTMTTRTLNREHRILSERATELGIPKKLLNKEKILSGKGIVSLDLETIV